MVKGVILGIVGAVVGAVAWALVSYYAHLEIGWLAWGVGALVGWLAMVGSGGRGGTQLGVAACVISLASIAAGKYAGAFLDARAAVGSMSAMLTTPTDEYMISLEADGIIKGFEADGKPVTWPDGVNPDDAATEAEYPPEIWKQAAKHWQALSDAERQTRRDTYVQETQAAFAGAEADLRNRIFMASFSAFDILWVVLAVATAYKLGSGGE